MICTYDTKIPLHYIMNIPMSWLRFFIHMGFFLSRQISTQAVVQVEKQTSLRSHPIQSDSSSINSPQCPMNEIWEECGSSTCWEFTCADLLYPQLSTILRPCTKDCRQGMHVDVDQMMIFLKFGVFIILSLTFTYAFFMRLFSH